ncbi:WD40 repeat-like protein [Paxillus ammoniavirescens]|nr:WD40 repeat-like protein [Paxillus ammoniavirescens]
MCSMSTTPRTPPSKSSGFLCSSGMSSGDAPDRNPSPSPLPRVGTLSPIPIPCLALRRSPRAFNSHAGSATCASSFENRPSGISLGNTSPRSQRHSPLTSQHAPLDIDLFGFVTPQSGSFSSRSSAAARREVTPPNLGLTLDLDFNTTLGLDFGSAGSSASTSGMSYMTAGSPGGILLPSPGDDDVFTIRETVAKDEFRGPNTEPSFEFSFVSRVDGASSIPQHGHSESVGSSGPDSDFTFQLRPRTGSGSAKRDPASYGFAEQRFIRSSLPTPYYTANSTPEPEVVDNEPRAGPSRLPFLDTNLTVTTLSPTGCISSHPFPLSGTDASQSQELQRPPSPAPTADFSMISPPSSPSFYRYVSQLAEGDEVDPFRSPHRRGTATLPFFRSTSTSVASGVPGAFHFTVNGRTQSMSPRVGLGPVISKPRRVRPGISRLWESLASPAKGSSTSLPVPQDAHLTPAPPSRTRSSPMPGFSAVRAKTSPMMGVGRKLKGKRRVKRPRRGALELNVDVDYGALHPLDGEEGELVGCTCTGWGDGACVCGYGYWDVYDYGCEHTQEPESMCDGAGSQPTPLTQLPPELFLQVLSYLPLHSVLAVASTCKAWRALAFDNGVWWGLWQAREGIPCVPNPNRSSNIGHRVQDSGESFGRRHRTVKDEGVHGLSIPTTEHEHDGEQWDEPRGWTVDFGRANMRLKESARLGYGAASTGVLTHPAQRRRQEGGQHTDTHAEEEGGDERELEQQEVTSSSELQPVSRQAPLTLDWCTLYRGRSILEQRWRDPEGEPHVLRIDGHRDSVYCLDFDSSRIISGSRDRTIKVWCIKTGRCLATFEGHTGSVLCLKFERDWDLGSDGVCRGFMVSGSSDCTVCVWDLISTPIAPGERSSVTSVGSGRLGNSRDVHGPPRKVSAEIRKVLRGHSAGVLDLRMDEKWIVTCSKDASMNVYDRRSLALHTVLRGHEGPVNAVGLENGRVVSASGDGKMMLWDVETGECVRVFEGHEKGLASIEFKDDLILSGSNDCTIKLWRASTGECLHTFAGHTSLVRALSFEPKTGYIVSTSYDKSVRVWEWREGAAETLPGVEGNIWKSKGVGRLVREYRNLHASHIFDVKFDVGKIVSTSHDQQIVVLDFSYGIEGAELFG